MGHVRLSRHAEIPDPGRRPPDVWSIHTYPRPDPAVVAALDAGPTVVTPVRLWRALRLAYGLGQSVPVSQLAELRVDPYGDETADVTLAHLLPEATVSEDEGEPEGPAPRRPKPKER